MTMADICRAERASMHTRKLRGYCQHDDHVWRWLNFYITLHVDAKWERVMGRIH